MVKRSNKQPPAAADAAAEGGAIAKKKAPPPLPESIKFDTYIARVHKQLQKDGEGRTISSGALSNLDALTDHLIAAIVTNSKHVMGYVRTTAFNDKAARAAAGLTLSGSLKKAALQSGSRAVELYQAKPEAVEAAA